MRRERKSDQREKVIKVTRRTALVLALALVATMAIAGVAFAKTFTGTQGVETIKGTQQADVMYSLNGSDRLEGRGGPDKPLTAVAATTSYTADGETTASKLPTGPLTPPLSAAPAMRTGPRLMRISTEWLITAST
jgi:hypothetical protein